LDDRGVGRLKIAQILPEFEEGGVERHVLWLSNALAEMGHEVTIITAGGKLEKKLDPKVALVRLPVQKKNPFTALYCAISIASRAKREGWNILHAHSRVPAWIAWWVAGFSGRPWVATAHAQYGLNAGLIPYRKANGVICVSRTVREHLGSFLPEKTEVIPNGIPPARRKWEGKGFPENPRFLFVGRLTRLKGLDVVIEALSGLGEREWTLDVVGDGPQREELEAKVRIKGLDEKIAFHGFRENIEEWMAGAGCLLFPSLEEGQGLVLAQAIQVGVPVIASEIEVLREMMGNDAELVKPGDRQGWRYILDKVVRYGILPRSCLALPVISTFEAANDTLSFYRSIIS
jgi:glycosyltransferase involved in cell wall biosynthesis